MNDNSRDRNCHPLFSPIVYSRPFNNAISFYVVYLMLMRCHRNFILLYQVAYGKLVSLNIVFLQFQEPTDIVKWGITVPRDFASINIQLICTNPHIGRYCYPNTLPYLEIRVRRDWEICLWSLNINLNSRAGTRAWVCEANNTKPNDIFEHSMIFLSSLIS